MKRKIENMSNLTFGIYIIHGFIYQIIREIYQFDNEFINIIVFFITILLSAIITKILSKNKYTQKLIS